MSLPMKRGPVSIGDEVIPPPPAVNRRRATHRITHRVALADRLCQIGYFWAYRMMRAWWFLRRPKHHGAVVALWHHGLLLMVRTSYRPRWDLPGGGVGPGEDARTAALRELREELGLALPENALTLVQSETIFWDFRHDHVSVFEAVLQERPEVRGRQPRDHRRRVPFARRDRSFRDQPLFRPLPRRRRRRQAEGVEAHCVFGAGFGVKIGGTDLR